MIDGTVSSYDNIEFYNDVIERLPEKIPLTIAINKIDKKNQNYTSNIDMFRSIAENNQSQRTINVLSVSAKNGIGLDDLKATIKDSVKFTASTEGNFIARRRHLDAIDKACIHIDESIVQLEEFSACELVAEELKMAQESLNLITGKFTSDDLLGKIFSSFCIGK